MVAASFISRRIRPGAPIVYYLSASINGESRHRYIRKGEVEYWRKREYAWRRFIKAMASWVKVNKVRGKTFLFLAFLQIPHLFCYSFYQSISAGITIFIRIISGPYGRHHPDKK